MRPLMLVTLLATSSLALAACTNAGQASNSKKTAPGAGVPATSTTAGSAAGKAALDPAVAALVPADIKAKGQLSFAMDASYAPFEYFDTDNSATQYMQSELDKLKGEQIQFDYPDQFKTQSMLEQVLTERLQRILAGN